MPAPGSEIPGSAPSDLVAQARGALKPEALFRPSVSEAEFLRRFPDLYRVRALTLYDAIRKGWKPDRTYWEFLAPFQFVSPTWGAIVIPKGFHTDFASVPPSLHSVIDDDSPIILFPSAPHDFLFTKRASDGTRGWLPNGKQLTLTETNRVLTEAMSFCGADKLTQGVVFAAVQLANASVRKEFAH